MDPISLATTLVGARASQTSEQIGMAVMRQRMNADRAVVAMVAGSASGATRSAVGPGLGTNLDISV